MSKNLKYKVKQKYSEIARKSAEGCSGPSSEGCCESGAANDIMAESYEELEGYTPDADLKLGCGIPVEHAMLAEGQHVLDLGSGAGNDLFVARRIVGDSGHLVGLDFSAEMNAKAEQNRQKLGYENMTFTSGDIENMPFKTNQFDVVLSNCVLNLVPDKELAFAEIFRVLKPGGHFAISDIVSDGEMDSELKKSAELYAGCVSGAIDKKDYLDIIRQAGFDRVAVKQERKIKIPETWIHEQIGDTYSAEDIRILSVTVTAIKTE